MLAASVDGAVACSLLLANAATVELQDALGRCAGGAGAVRKSGGGLV